MCGRFINMGNDKDYEAYKEPQNAATKGSTKVSAKLNILALISPYSEKPKVRHVSDFNLGSFT